MQSTAQRRIAESLRAFREVFANPNLRRLELASAGSIVGAWAYIVALAVFAYDAGGAAAVGLVGFIRLLPSAVATPFAALLADRMRRERVMVASDLSRCAALSLAAVFVFVNVAPAVYVLAGLAALAATPFDPAERALLPSLATRPEELTAANAVASTVGSAGIFAGPALGGALLAVTSSGVVFVVTAATLLWSAFLVARITAPPGPRPNDEEDRRGIVPAALAGFRAIGADGRLRLLVAFYGVATLVAGILDVLVVPTALELLDLGESGVGYFFAAIGIGGVLGGVVTLVLATRQRLAADFALGMVLFGLPIALLGVFSLRPLAFALLVVLGVANTIVGVACTTLLQRTVPNALLARVFGVLGTLVTATVALGSIVAPGLIAALGVRGALIVTGAAPAAVAVLLWRPLARLDAGAAIPERELELLAAVPMLHVLPPETLEALAATSKRVDFAEGVDVFRAGDPGERFYIVDEGEVVVETPGGEAKTLGARDFFGEIALLRDVPRTATVTAATDTRLLTLERDPFVGAVTGHAPSAAAADATIAARLGDLRPSLGSV